MSVSLIVPYRPGERVNPPRRGEGAIREDIWAWMEKRWQSFFPRFELCLGDAGGDRFNRAAARNEAVSRASGDILVLADADVIFDPIRVREAMVALHRNRAEWVLPYEHYEQLTGLDTMLILEGPVRSRIERPLVPRWTTLTGNAGCMVITREAFETVGGYDEAFFGWGWEDWAFADALECLVHTQYRTAGHVLHVMHPKSPGHITEKRAARKLYDPYIRARGDPDAMRALIDERPQCQTN